MALSIEFFKDQDRTSRLAKAWLSPCVAGAVAAGFGVKVTTRYEGKSDWLCICGAGDPSYNMALARHIASGRPVVCWDLGYVGSSKDTALCYMRCAIGGPHPTHESIDRTPPDPRRWLRLGIELSEVAAPDGHVLVIGIGPKSHAHLGQAVADWEIRTLRSAAARFPGRRIVYRAKPYKFARRARVDWPHRSDASESIRTALQGASLVICRHSNVSVDACIGGVPVECEAGAALWLYCRGDCPTPEQRLDFLYRLCWWQWRAREMDEAWDFIRKGIA